MGNIGGGMEWKQGLVREEVAQPYATLHAALFSRTSHKIAPIPQRTAEIAASQSLAD